MTRLSVFGASFEDRQKHAAEYRAFALVELQRIEQSQAQAFATFGESLKDALKNYEQFGLSQTMKEEATILHAEIGRASCRERV